MFGFAKKLGMTRLVIDSKMVPVTVLEFNKQFIVQRKTTEKDGYAAVQVGLKPKKNSTKAAAGHVKAHLKDEEKAFTYLTEFKVAVNDDQKELDVNGFAQNDLIRITGTSKGKGFTGAVKRYGFAGQPASHGHDHVRAVGSIGARWPQRTIKGTKMAGHSGSQTSTLNKVKILAVDAENEIIFVNGSIPGANGKLLRIQKV